MFNNIFANGSDSLFNFYSYQQKDNLQKAIQQKNLIESRYFNPDSPLAKAQMYSDNLMMAKQRVPMVIEYFKHKPTGPDDNYIESVPMYINPQKLSISTQKVKGKAYTRGGIVYHHYGDDHFSMQLSGTVGLAGMKGIEVLQDIYHHSGALLRYQSVGPNKLGQYEGNYKTVDYNDPTGVLNYLVTNDLASDNQAMLFQQLEYARNGQSLASQRKMYDLVSYIASSYLNTLGIQTISTTYEDLQSKVQEYYNTYLRDNNNQTPSFENLYQYAQSIVNVDKNYGQIDNSTKVAIAFELVKPYYYDKFTSVDMNTIADIGTALDSDTIYSKIRDLTYSQADELSNYIQAVTDINSKNVIDRDSAFQGWSDIADELLDEWRPRQVFVYFQDRVYIGHFDTFSYQQVAETPLIQYDMKLTIFREIITTTNNSDKKPTSAQTLSNYVNQITSNPEPDDLSAVNDFKSLPEYGRFEIFHLRADLAVGIRRGQNFSDQKPTQDDKDRVAESVEELRTIAGDLITEKNCDKNLPEYELYNGDPRLQITDSLLWQFLAHARLSPNNETDPLKKEFVQYEIDSCMDTAADWVQLMKEVWDKEIKNGVIYNPGRKDQLLKYVRLCREASGYNGNRWEDSANVTEIKKTYKVGDRVKVSPSATVYATGEIIPDWVKQQSNTIMQVKTDRVLLREIYSWVLTKDII